MNTDIKKQVAVFTGDLVGSTRLTQAQIEAAFATLENCASKAAEWHGASLQFSRHRGDGWQVMLAEPKYMLRTALYFRAALKALGAEFDTYIGIATGLVKTDIDTDLNYRNESVFALSGTTLDKIKIAREISLRMAYYSSNPENRASVEGATIVLADKIASDWSQVQAEAITQKLASLDDDVTYAEIARTLGKSRQSVSKTLNAAGAGTIQTALSFWEFSYD